MIFRFADFELDTDRRELRRAGAVVAVQPKVFGLLANLVEQRDRTVPKAELFATLWPDQRVGETSLTRAIRGARLALGEDGDSQRAIRSQRGIGYRFELPVEVVSAPERAPYADAPRVGSMPLIGREVVLNHLDGLLVSSGAGRGGLALLSGPPGIGKTRLVDEFAARARARGVDVLVGRCLESEGAPAFWPWAQVVRSLVRSRGAAALTDALGRGAADIVQALPGLATLLPGVAAAPPIDPAELRFRFRASMAELLRCAAGAQPLAIVLDDVHRADLPSLRLLQVLAHELADAPVLVVATRRDVAALDPDRARALAELARGSGVDRTDLEGLDADSVARFVALATGTSPTPDAVAVLYERTSGNPLFLAELLELGARVDAGAWSRRGALPHALAQGLEAAIERHLEELGSTCRATLQMAAVLGREFALRPLAAALVERPAVVLEHLGEAVAARILEPLAAQPGSWRFVHALIPEVICAALSPAERARLHGRAGTAILAQSRGDHEPHLAELAHHFTQAALAGDVERAAVWTERAARHAAGQMAFEEAAALYERALGLLADDEASDEHRCELLLAAASAWTWAGDLERARLLDRRALDLARVLDSGPLFARAVRGARTDVQTGRSDPERVGLLEEALRRLGPEDSTLRVELIGMLGAALYFDEPEDHFLERGRTALAIARRLAEPKTIVNALCDLHFALLSAGGLEERARLTGEMLALAARAGDDPVFARAWAARSYDALEAGDRVALDTALDARAEIAARLRHPSLLWECALGDAMRALLDGDVAVAESRIEETLRAGQRIQSDLALECYAVQIYVLRREQGRLTELEPGMRRLMAMFPAMGTWPIALALLEVEDGRHAAGRERIAPLFQDGALQVRRDINHGITLAVLAEVCVALGDGERAAAVYTALLPYAGRHVMIGPGVAGYGAADRPLGLLAALLGRNDEALARLARAHAADVAIGARLFAAHDALELADRLAASDRADGRREAADWIASVEESGASLGSLRIARRVAVLRERIGYS